MNFPIFLFIFFLVVGLVGTLAYFYNSIALFMIGSLGGLMYFVTQIFYTRAFPVRLRTYGERLDSFNVDNDTRARVVKDKKGHEYLETLTGKRFKMPGRKYLTKGSNSVFADLYDDHSQQFPVVVDRSNLKEIRNKIIPENQRVWFARSVIPEVKEITKPPVDRTSQLIALGAIGFVVVLMVAAMIFLPIYYADFEKIQNAYYSKLNQKWEEVQKIYEEGPIVCQCANPPPPAQQPPTPPG